MGSSGVGAVVTAGLLALALPAAFVAVAVSRDIPLLPGGSPPPVAESPQAEASAPLAVLSESPAVRSLTEALNTGPGGPWTASSGITWAVGTPYDYACELAADTPWPRAVVSAQRTFTDGSRAATVSLHAYGAGAGAVAFSSLRERLDRCPQRESTVLTGTGSVGSREAVVASVRPVGFPQPVTTLAWREGDVLIDVHSGTLPAEQLQDAADRVDLALRAALRSTCPDLDSDPADASRSPWVDRRGYTGLTVDEPVTLPARPLPSPPEGLTARGLDTELEPLPTPQPPESTPDAPVWPPLPEPVPQPVVPSPVGMQPTETAIAVPRRDEIGPGCGWRFTGQEPPEFDEAGAQARRSTLVTEARSTLKAGQDAWQASVLTFWREVAAYEAGIGAYRLYTAQLDQVRVAWAAIQAAREAYSAALDEWEAQTLARAQLVAAQQTAAREYQAALDACALVPVPTATPTPGPPIPGFTPTPTPSPTLTCPPERPAVLDQPLPTIGPAPTPPPDPRPGRGQSAPSGASPTASPSR